MSILEDNKLIFNWMGGKCEVDGKGVPYTSRIPDYHSDWNQLMEVVEKIESGDYKVEIDGVFCEISSILKGRDIRIFIEGSIKIQAVYQAVLEYIKQKEAGNA